MKTIYQLLKVHDGKIYCTAGGDYGQCFRTSAAENCIFAARGGPFVCPGLCDTGVAKSIANVALTLCREGHYGTLDKAVRALLGDDGT